MMFSNPLVAIVLGALFGGFLVSGGDEREETETDGRKVPQGPSQKDISRAD